MKGSAVRIRASASLKQADSRLPSSHEPRQPPVAWVRSLIHSPTALEVTTPKAEMSSPTGLPWRARIRRGLWAEAQHLAGAREDALVRDVECAVGSEDEPARRDEIRHDRGARAVRVHPQQNARPGESWSDGEFENVEPLARTPPDVDDRREARPVDRRRLPRDDAVD